MMSLIFQAQKSWKQTYVTSWILFSQEQYSEAQQERIELLRARVLEVNRHLATLGGNSNDTSKDNNTAAGLPLHMNLAVQSQSRQSHMQVLSQLKRQNHVLTRVRTSILLASSLPSRMRIKRFLSFFLGSDSQNWENK